MFERPRDDGVHHGGVEAETESALHLHLRRLEQADPDGLAPLLHHRHPQLLHHQEDRPVKPVSIKNHIEVSILIYSMLNGLMTMRLLHN